MARNLHVAAIQLNACDSPQDNLARGLAMVDRAARAGAEWVVLPEMFVKYGDLGESVQTAETISQTGEIYGPIVSQLANLAKERSIVLVAGSICEAADQAKQHRPQAAYNTQLVFDRRGKLVARYRKLHLFDINLPEKVVACESDHIVAGDQVVVETIDGICCGLAICYDLRFPELFRAMRAAGAELITLPSAFTKTTGQAHWKDLVRARAIENQCFVIAANQFGQHNARQASYGHSLIIDPWGEVLASTGDQEAILYATLALDRVAKTRQRLPAWEHRRLDVDISSTRLRDHVSQ
jgi:predicted amidohydrolase